MDWLEPAVKVSVNLSQAFSSGQLTLAALMQYPLLLLLLIYLCIYYCFTHLLHSKTVELHLLILPLAFLFFCIFPDGSYTKDCVEGNGLALYLYINSILID